MRKNILILTAVLGSLFVTNSYAEQPSLSDLLAKPKKEVLTYSSIDATGFLKKFKDNKKLRREDLVYFPKRLRLFLRDQGDWKANHTTGFSKHLKGRTYLFSVKKEGGGFNSNAVLVTIGRPTVDQKSITWEKLYLPYLEPYKNKVEISSRSYHSNLVWDEETQLVRTTFCHNLKFHRCIRNYHKVYRSEHRLIKIEVVEPAQDKQTTVWHKGEWLIDLAEKFQKK